MMARRLIGMLQAVEKEFYPGLIEEGSRKSYKEVKHYKRRKRWLG